MSSTKKDFLTQIRPEPSPYKQRLCELGISAGVVAKYVGLTYPYMVNRSMNGLGCKQNWQRLSPSSKGLRGHTNKKINNID
jgi:hypothetical protein